MKILRVWLIAICLSTTVWSKESDLAIKITQFARSPEWLGHFFYDGETDRYTSLVESSYYFLSKTGKYNPEDELRETIRRLSTVEDIAEEDYCRYVGRFELVLNWFPEYRKSTHTCKAFNEWQSTLSIDEVRLSFATGFIKNPASSFGHLFLKLVSKKQKAELLNYGINFSAQTGEDTGAIYALKGLIGQYRGTFTFLPYHQLIKDYSDLEGRDIWELDLKLDEFARMRLLRFIYEFDSNYIDYTFANNNCAGILERLVHYLQQRPLNRLRELKPWTIPLESFQEMASGVDLQTYYFIPSLKTQLAFMETQLTQLEKQKIKYEFQTRDFQYLSGRELDYVILDRKLNRINPDSNYDLELMKARSRINVETHFKELNKSNPKAELIETPKTSVLGVYKMGSDFGVEVGFLSERLIYGRNLSEINILNFRTQNTSTEKKRSMLKDVEIFSFLAGESVDFLHSPFSYGVGIFYRDNLDIVAEGNLGVLLKKDDWLFFPKMHAEAGKRHNRIVPEIDIYNFSAVVNSKLTIGHENIRLDFFRYFKPTMGIHVVNIYDTGRRVLTDTSLSGLIFF
ncbi:MAG: DUF4105 domain-containing protein [Bdellovibrionaceae bacterium]|nr:DUF4105 domain-containing protein [Pseudobdellovibrionaceae bacterium]